MTRLLLERGAEVMAKDMYGHTALEYAKKHPKVLKLLKEWM